MKDESSLSSWQKQLTARIMYCTLLVRPRQEATLDDPTTVLALIKVGTLSSNPRVNQSLLLRIP